MASPNLVQAIGRDADAVVRAAAESHFVRLIGPEHNLAVPDVQRATAAIEWAIDCWVDILLGFINTQGGGDTFGSQELFLWANSSRRWLEDEELAAELLRTMLYPEHPWFPRIEVLEASRRRAQPAVPPWEYPWAIHARSFRSGMENDRVLDAGLRDSLRRFVLP